MNYEEFKLKPSKLKPEPLGEQKANIANAEGLRQANILKAQGESQAIKIIDVQLQNSTTYLDWLKTQRWDGKLPLVTGSSGGAGGGSDVGAIPFIEIPLGSQVESTVSASNSTLNSTR